MDTRRRRFLDAISGRKAVTLDTNACIYYLDEREPFAELVASVIDLASTGSIEVMLSAIVQLELLVRPYALGNQMLIKRVIEFTEEHAGIRTSSISRGVVMATGQVRAITRFKLPDALIIGTAAAVGAELIIGNDSKFARLNSMRNMEILSDGYARRLPAFLRLDDYV